ncbi:hypothetical protein F7725_021026 [Dissostichus mawsoni]|uniref:Uncharacterized protein n=1 Tax=Dissostichus mawsoni TaxID=36200 RepID=A0A7J5YI95_DISMA|nr:hypothetical protein F7725_021026 [Dissostichus mawsoni]
MEHSDFMTHKNGRQRKAAGVALSSESMTDIDRVEMSSPDPELEEEAEGLIRGFDSEDRRHRVRPAGIRGELGNVLLLLFLYVLQGIPLGLAGSIPLILQSKSVSYKDQAFFSFVFWPFSLKLLWAPLVDALYFSRFGRRKSWLVPTQYLLGLFMLYLSVTVNSLLQSEGGPKVSADFCNKYLRSEPQDTGIVTLLLVFLGDSVPGFTTLVAIMKKENEQGKGKKKVQEETQGVMATYKLLFNIIKMPTVFTFCALLLTAKMGFSAADAVTGLKLVEAGVPKEQLALLAVPMVPLQILLPVIISDAVQHVRGLHGLPCQSERPLIGGTYMTLLNTVTNLGGNWPSTVALWMVDPLTSKEWGAAGRAVALRRRRG